ncbi:MAG: hypothetical protein RR199_03800 [Alistipes sp.]
MAAQAHNGRGAVVLLQSSGERHRAEQVGGVALLFGGGLGGKMVVLHRLDVFPTTARIQIRHDFTPVGRLEGYRFARPDHIEPRQDSCRDDEQQEDE